MKGSQKFRPANHVYEFQLFSILAICIIDTCVCGNGWTGEFCEKVAKATNVNVTLNSADSFTIKWENPAPEVNTGAEINCVPDSEGSITVYKTVGPNQTAITINDLEDGKFYKRVNVVF